MSPITTKKEFDLILFNKYIQEKENSPNLTDNDIAYKINMSIRELNRLLRIYGFKKDYHRKPIKKYTYDDETKQYILWETGEYVWCKKTNTFVIPIKKEKENLTERRNRLNNFNQKRINNQSEPKLRMKSKRNTDSIAGGGIDPDKL